MATMHPAAPANDAPASEKQVFTALREGLPKDWFVIHAQRLNLPRQGKHPPFEGEADFIVFHPQRGLMVLEVKGGRIERDGDGWHSYSSDDQRHDIKDPGVQAQRSAHALGRYLRDHPAFHHRRHAIPYGHGVVFPSIEVRRTLDPSLPRAQLLDRLDLHNVRDSIERLYLARNLGSQSDIAALAAPLLDAIAPTVNLLPALQGQFEHEARLLHRLTEEQKRLLDFIASNHRVAIQGVAGSGKTLVAMEKARRLAAEGQRVLFLCFNLPLARHLAPQAQGFEVHNYHRFCHERCEAAGIPFDVPDAVDDKKTFFGETAPELLLQALEARPEDRYDALIIDEGQDFLELWWPSVEALLEDPKNSTLYVFYDPNQNLFGGGPTQALGLTIDLNLTHNCRNTARIAEYSTALIDQSAVLHPDTPEGIAVEEIHLTDPTQTPATIQRLLHRFCHDEKVPTSDIVILTARSERTSALSSHRNLGNYHLVPLDDPLRPGLVRFTSIRKFKGLEAPVVLITDVDRTHPTCSAQDLHVGTSRARHALIAITINP